MNFKERLANYVLGNAGRASLIEAAVQALAEGYDARHLRMLAGESPTDLNPFEIDRLLERALDELALTLSSETEAAHVLITYWTRAIVAGAVSPRTGARHIRDDVYRRLAPFPEEQTAGAALGIARLVGAAYQYDDLREGFIVHEGRPLTLSQAQEILDAAVLEEARSYLSLKQTRSKR